MNKYTVDDFEESINKVGLKPSEILGVIGAWGGPEEWDGWEGGFIMALTKYRIAYLTGWCDYSGWGCQDGADLHIKDGSFYWEDKIKQAREIFSIKDTQEIDLNPVDLNHWILKKRSLTNNT